MRWRNFHRLCTRPKCGLTKNLKFSSFVDWFLFVAVSYFSENKKKICVHCFSSYLLNFIAIFSFRCLRSQQQNILFVLTAYIKMSFSFCTKKKKYCVCICAPNRNQFWLRLLCCKNKLRTIQSLWKQIKQFLGKSTKMKGFS